MKFSLGAWLAILFISFITGGFGGMIVLGALSGMAIVAADHSGTKRNELGGGGSRKQLY